MSVSLRLQRHGTHKRPSYRVVAADSRSPRDGRFLELLGSYDPMHEPNVAELNVERIQYWISQGAQASETVTHVLKLVKDGRTLTPSQFSERRRAATQAAREAAWLAKPGEAKKKAAPAASEE
jgi:small subunit ribosomal protein S16